MSQRVIPPGLEKYGQTPIFTEATMPAKLTAAHTTKPGVWGRLVVSEGALDYVVPGPPMRCQRIVAGGFGIIEPTVPHHIGLMGPVTFRVEFHRAPKGQAAPEE